MVTNKRLYLSPHGIEQDRRDFMKENPTLYKYIEYRIMARTLDSAGDLISGWHQAANRVWHQAALMRQRHESMHKDSVK